MNLVKYSRIIVFFSLQFGRVILTLPLLAQTQVVKFFKKFANEVVDLFLANVPILYPLKTPGNLLKVFHTKNNGF